MIIYRAKVRKFVPKTPQPCPNKDVQNFKNSNWFWTIDSGLNDKEDSCWIMLWGNHEFHDLKPALFVIRSSRIISHSCIWGKSRRQWIVDITIKSTIKAHLASKRQRRLFISCFHQQTGPARSELLQGPVSLGALIGADRRDDLRVTHAKTWCNQLNKRNLAIIWRLY